ncbi:MAG: L-fucose/L-arabinose isomerase family protein [bacterium]
MCVNFRKVRLGFVNLTLSFLKGQEKAVELSREIIDYLEKELDTKVIEFPELVAQRPQAKQAWLRFKAENVDAIILFNGTFNTGELVAEIARNLDCPFALWGLSELALPTRDFSGSMVAVMAAGTIFKNFGKEFTFIYGTIKEEETRKKVHVFVNTVRAIAYLKEATIAVIGMRPDGFQIAGADELAIKKLFGTEIINVSTYTFSKIVKQINEKDVDSDIEIQKEIFDIKPDDLLDARGTSRMYLALKKITKEKNIQAYAPECWPEFRDVDETPFCPANSRMSTEGVTASCECDIDGAVTMMLEHAITGNSVFFADFVNFIKDNDTVLFWHCGNAPYDLAKSKPVCQKIFGGLSTTSALKSGVVTVCRINSIKGRFMLHAGTGDAIEAEPVLRGSNILVRMRGGNKEFVESLLENGIPHHNAIVYGDITEELNEFAKFMGIPTVTCS